MSTSTPLVLSLFPGIGLLDRAFEEAGFCIVRGPDLLWGGDVHRFHPPVGRFDGIIGGPPCQAFSRLRHLVAHNGLESAPNLIPEFERCVNEAQPQWFLMENVPASPLPLCSCYSTSCVVLNNRWVGGEQERTRKFTLGLRRRPPVDLAQFIEVDALELYEKAPTVCASGGVKPGIPTDRRIRAKYLGWKTAEALRESIRLQGLPDEFLSDAPLTLEGKHRVVGNGVPLPMGRAIAAAVKAAISEQRIPVCSTTQNPQKELHE